MAWDFSTAPDFEEKLEWMRSFVRDEVYPLETLDLDEAIFRRLTDPLKEEVKKQGLWAVHLYPELGGQGFGQVKLELMHEILGSSIFAPSIFGNQAPDSGNAELIAIGATEDQKERWLWPLLEGKLRSAFSMTEPETAGSDPTLLKTRAVRDGDEWVINGHKWFTSNGSSADFLVLMAITNPDAHPYQGTSMIIVPVDTPGVDIAMIKYFGARVLYNVIDRAIQIHGALGYSTDLPLEAMYRHARAARLYDGADEVHRVTVARQILKNYSPHELPSEHVPTRRDAAKKKFAALLDEATANS